jgi:uncharacterized membrane protein YbhN (UPF0104 family)
LTGLWTTLGAAFRLLVHMRAGYACGALGLFALSVVVVAFRWQLVLRALGQTIAARETLLAYLASMFAANVTPARTIGGDAGRIAIISSRSDAPVAVVTASVLYDRLSEVPAIGLLVLLAAPVLELSPGIVGGVVAVLAVLFGVGPVRRILTSRIGRWHTALVGVKAEQGRLGIALALSVFVWLLDISRIMCEGAAFGVALTPSQAASVSVLRLAAGVIPVPGGVGVTEGALIAALVWLGVPSTTATAMTIVERAIMYGGGTCAGFLALMVLGGRHVLTRWVRPGRGAPAEQAAALANGTRTP